MLKLSHLSLALPDGRILLNDLSLTLQAREHLALVGEEGDGKSTLLKLLAGEQADYVSCTGSFFTDWKTGLLPQQIDPVWNDLTPIDYLLRHHPEEDIAPEAWSDCVQLEAAARQCGLDPELLYVTRPVSTLSGGEKVRLSLVKLLAQEPDLLLLDEPANDLDLPALEWLEHWIASSPLPIIFISHDVHLLKACAGRILHLEQRNKKTKPVWTLFEGGWDAYLENRTSQRQKTAQQARNEKLAYEKKKQHLNDLANKVEGQLRTVSRQRPHEGMVLKKKMKAVRVSQDFLESRERTTTDTAEEEMSFFLPSVPFPAGKKIADETVVVERNGTQLMEPFELSLYGPLKLVITGPNGCGKSTLLRQLWESLKQRSDLKAGWMPQNYDEAFLPGESPVSFLLRFSDDTTLIRTRLGSMHFTEREMDQPVSDCSGGQKAKLILASLALQNCNVILLDEPTRSLSPLSVGVLSQALRSCPAALIAVSHDITFIDSVFDQKAVIQDGKWMLQAPENRSTD